jgi:hypothetical protein
MVLFHLWVPCIDIRHLGSPELFYKGEAAELNPFEESGLRVDCQLFSLTLTLHWQEQVGLGFYVQILGLAHESFWNVVAATARAVGHLQKSADVMKLVNGLMKTPEMAVTMQEFSKEMLKAGVIEEVMSDELDSALDNDDIEEEIEEEVDKVLSELAGETAAQLPAAARREHATKQADAQTEPVPEKEEAVAEGGDDDAELEALRARLANVRS